MSQGEAMVANGYDGLNRRVKRGIKTQAAPGPNNADVYRHLFYNAGWEEQRRIMGEGYGSRGHGRIGKTPAKARIGGGNGGLPP